MTKDLPLALPRLVMRRAARIGVIALLLVAMLGLWRTHQNIIVEVDSAMNLADLMARLAQLERLDDAQALHALGEALARDEFRHLELRVHGIDGRLLLAPPSPEPDAWPLAVLLRLHQDWLSAPEHRVLSWMIPRPGPSAWRISVTASPDSERREALTDLLGVMGLLSLGLVLLLAAMRSNVTRAFQPLALLLGAIAGIESRVQPLAQFLPTMPIHELEVIAQALRRLSTALDEAEAQRRLLSQKVLTLQEDERTFLARELHDEFGQRLTALRFDAAWLGKQVVDQPALRHVVVSMNARCAEVQADIRALLVRLSPLDASEGSGSAPSLTLGRLQQMLEVLLDSWRASLGHDSATRFELAVQMRDLRGESRAARDEELTGTHLSRATVLAIYRLSQEALTNIARHAEARRVRVTIELRPSTDDASAQSSARLAWTVTDDGRGMPEAILEQHKGNGLGGMQERVWALGGEWSVGPASSDGRGVILSAVLPLGQESLADPT